MTPPILAVLHPAKQEYRVVWKRVGLSRRYKRYRMRRAAERFMTLLGPEPWKAFEEDPDGLVCCPGEIYNLCACGGMTYREQSEEIRKSMPALEYIRLEVRSVGLWQEV